MADDVDAFGEASEDLTVSVTIDHLAAIPEGVVIVDIVMDIGDDRHPPVVNGIALIDIVVEVIGVACSVIGFVDRNILAAGITFFADQSALRGLPVFVRAVIDSTGFTPDGRR
jgi:hypothetical protein